MSRTRLTGGLVTLIAALFLAQYLRAWLAIPAPQARTSDFAGTYAAAMLWREGQPGRMYDTQAQEQVLLRAGTPRDHLYIPFENPPPAAVVASPLSLLGADAAYRGFSALQLLLLLAGVVAAARAAPWPAATGRAVKLAVMACALAGIGTGLLLVEGQWDGVAALGVGLAYAAWRRDRPGWAGLAAGVALALAKPHLGLGLLAFAAGRRDWRAAGGMAAGAVGVAMASLATTGVGGTGAFVHALLQPANNPLLVMQGASGFFASWLGTSAPALTLTALAVVAGVGAAAWMGAQSRRPALFEPAFAGAVALSLLVSIHLLGHDLTLLAPALVALLAWLARRSASPRSWPDVPAAAALLTWAAMSFASQQDLGNYSPAPPGRLTPVVLAAMAGACCAVVARVSGARSARSGAASAPSLSPSAPR
ncbi:MAG: DUF2029 domain-containing protein [Candidatus Dormibacteraeota bacterium]|nr:DUF2029 domain-containing protein [Candidatus Dormibacteraeota bacterium]MBV9525060.1 DUF2029 domain-containing protein [Candidatus Dormibacteraeota bacterium]